MKAIKGQEEPTIEEIVPIEYHNFLNVFSSNAANRMPRKTKWDHTIELKPEFQTIFSEFYDIVHSLEQMDRLKRRKNYDDFLSAIDINLEGRITNEY